MYSSRCHRALYRGRLVPRPEGVGHVTGPGNENGNAIPGNGAAGPEPDQRDPSDRVHRRGADAGDVGHVGLAAGLRVARRPRALRGPQRRRLPGAGSRRGAPPHTMGTPAVHTRPCAELLVELTALTSSVSLGQSEMDALVEGRGARCAAVRVLGWHRVDAHPLPPPHDNTQYRVTHVHTKKSESCFIPNPKKKKREEVVYTTHTTRAAQPLPNDDTVVCIFISRHNGPSGHRRVAAGVRPKSTATATERCPSGTYLASTFAL